MGQVKCSNQLRYFFLDGSATRHSFPVCLHTVHQVIYGSRAAGSKKIFQAFTAGCRYPKSLAFMLAAAFCSYLSIAFSQQRAIATHIYFKLIAAGSIVIAKYKTIKQNSFGLPRHCILQLL